jgi:hypothetical protein
LSIVKEEEKGEDKIMKMRIGGMCGTSPGFSKPSQSEMAEPEDKADKKEEKPPQEEDDEAI